MGRAEDRAAFDESADREATRIRMLDAERGRAAAVDFARQTLRSYRRAVVLRTAPAAEPVYRLRLMGSYCYLKRWLASQEGRGSDRH